MKLSLSLVLGLPVIASLGLLAPASAGMPGAEGASACDAHAPPAATSAPSKLDYVVLASVADAPNTLALYAASAHSNPATAR